MEEFDRKRKPRRTFGTPSYIYRNRFAYAVLFAGATVFTAISYTPFFRKANENIWMFTLEPSSEELERRELFSFPAARTSKSIQGVIDEKKRLMSER